MDGVYSMVKLKEFLNTLEEGKVSEDDVTKLAYILSYYWNEFSGNGSEGMEGYKLVGRMEDVYWEPPIISFDIERHGCTVLGSTKAAIHTWRVDIEKKIADCCDTWRHRVVGPRSKPLNVAPLAEEISNLILNHKEDHRLKWFKNGNILIKTGEFIDGVKETRIKRRKRFRNKINEILLPLGWETKKANHYTPPDLNKKTESKES
jgi:hypothetical protein